MNSLTKLLLLIAIQASCIQPNSLLHHSKNVYSQRGEDGILAEILRRLHITNGFFIEFGAWDGIHLSNSRHLFDQGWSGAFIEAQADRYQDLIRNYANSPNITCIREWVGYDRSQGKTLDQIADQYFPNQEIDFLSIDIDGADYLIFESLERKPKIICIEGGFSWHPQFTTRVPDEIAFQNLQQPLAVVIEIGKKKGYQPICFTQNTFFIRNDLYEAFSNIANDTVSLWQDAWDALPESDKISLKEMRRSNQYLRENDTYILN
jgi:hypothetical protein